jgi:hypothetical protein
MAEILRRFLNMCKAATAPIPRENPLEFEALNQMRMETETTAIVSFPPPPLRRALPLSPPLAPAFLLSPDMEREAIVHTDQPVQISEIENLLQLSREMKMLWIMGPLRTPGEDEAQQADLDAKAQRVRELYNQVMAMQLQQRKTAAEAKVLGTNQSA